MFQDFRSVQLEQESKALTNPQKPPFEIFSLLCTQPFELSKLVVAHRGVGQDPATFSCPLKGTYSWQYGVHPTTSGSTACFNCCMMEPDAPCKPHPTPILVYSPYHLFQATPQLNSTFECPQMQARAEHKGFLLSARSAGLDFTKVSRKKYRRKPNKHRPSATRISPP